MTTAALVQLAVKVHGWRHDPEMADEDETGICCFMPEANGHYHEWDPPTNITQAGELLEAWRKQKPKMRRWTVASPDPVVGRFTAQLFEHGTGMWSRDRATFAGAATAVVCDAMGIDPEAAE